MRNQSVISNLFWLHLYEQIGNLYPGQHKPSRYIDPVIKAMTAEWKRAKLKVVDAVMAAVRQRVVTESLVLEAKAIEFDPRLRSQMQREVKAVMQEYKAYTGSLIEDALKKAKGDTVPKLVSVGKGRGGFTTVALSKQGMQEVVDSLQWQKDFVDDVTKSVTKRVATITKGRYASSYDLRSQINRTFRIDRDKSIKNFHSSVEDVSNRLRAGRITAGDFELGMRKNIESHYRKLYQEGKGTARLEKWEEEFIRRQAHTQDQYLSNFRQYINQRQAMGEELTGRVNQRAHLYAERGTALFEAGHLASLPDDVLVNWEMQPAEHCPTCPTYEVGSPYTKETLPGLPGEGFNVTRCGTNCQCILQVSELYVTKTPEPERDLAIKITKPEPPKPGGLERISKSTVIYKGKTYKRVGGAWFVVSPTGQTKVIPYDLVPRLVRSEIDKPWKMKAVKRATLTKPKPQKLVSKPLKPKTTFVKPTEELQQAMGKTKYMEPEDVRKQMNQMVSEKKKFIAEMRKKEDALRVQLKAAKAKYYKSATNPTFERLMKDPDYKKISSQMDDVSRSIRENSKRVREEMQKLVRASEEGFHINKYIETRGVKGFEKRAKDGVREFTKLIDKDIAIGHNYGSVRVRARGKVYRANASRDAINLKDGTKRDAIIHEMGHWLEHTNDDVRREAIRFYRYRTSKDKLEHLGAGYRADEYTRKDRFIHKYMGKDYKGQVTELVSLGLEQMSRAPYKLASKDPEMFDWLYRLVRGMPIE